MSKSKLNRERFIKAAKDEDEHFQKIEADYKETKNLIQQQYSKDNHELKKQLASMERLYLGKKAEHDNTVKKMQNILQKDMLREVQKQYTYELDKIYVDYTKNINKIKTTFKLSYKKNADSFDDKYEKATKEYILVRKNHVDCCNKCLTWNDDLFNFTNIKQFLKTAKFLGCKEYNELVKEYKDIKNKVNNEYNSHVQDWKKHNKIKQIESMQIETTQIESNIESTQIESTQIESTQIETTQIESNIDISSSDSKNNTLSKESDMEFQISKQNYAQSENELNADYLERVIRLNKRLDLEKYLHLNSCEKCKIINLELIGYAHPHKCPSEECCYGIIEQFINSVKVEKCHSAKNGDTLFEQYFARLNNEHENAKQFIHKKYKAILDRKNILCDIKSNNIINEKSDDKSNNCDEKVIKHDKSENKSEKTDIIEIELNMKKEFQTLNNEVDIRKADINIKHKINTYMHIKSCNECKKNEDESYELKQDNIEHKIDWIGIMHYCQNCKNLLKLHDYIEACSVAKALYLKHRKTRSEVLITHYNKEIELMKNYDTQMTSEQNITYTILYAEKIWAQLKTVTISDLEYGKKEDDDKIKLFKEKHDKFYKDFPIVARYMICTSNYNKDAFRLFLSKLLTQKVTNSEQTKEDSWCALQADYVKYLYKFSLKNKHLNSNEVKHVWDKTYDMLKKEFTDFRKMYDDKVEVIEVEKKVGSGILTRELLERLATDQSVSPDLEQKMLIELENKLFKQRHKKTMEALLKTVLNIKANCEGRGTNKEAKALWDNEVKQKEMEKKINTCQNQ